MVSSYGSTNVPSGLERASTNIIKAFNKIDPDNKIDAEDLIIEVLVAKHVRLDHSILVYNIEELFDEIEKTFESNLTLACMRTILRLMKLDYFTHQEVRALAVRHWFTRYTLETYTSLTPEQITKIVEEVEKYKEEEAKRQDEYEIEQAKVVRKR